MKKFNVLVSLILMSSTPLFSQTPAEFDKIIKDVNKKLEKMKNDPKYKDLLKGIPPAETNPAVKEKEPAGITKPDTRKLPVKNNLLLSQLPKKKFSRQELVSFLNSLFADLQKKLPAEKVKAAQAIISQLNKDAAQIAGTGLLAWYKNAPSEAALLIVYAASQSPDDNTLNNCGAILNLCGLEEKAIPVLKYALANQPANSTLLNNIGQAYTGLGDPDTAMYYLMGCIRQSANHPEACATVAYIEYEKGNIEKAQQYAEQSIKGGYSSTTAKFYKSIKKGAKLSPLMKSWLSGRKYFQFNGFSVPDNCRKWEDCEEVYAKQQSFKKKIEALREQLKQVVIQNTQTITSPTKSLNWKEGPFAKLAQELKIEISDLYHEAKTPAHMDYLEKLVRTSLEEHENDMALNYKYIPLFKAAEKNPPLYERYIHEKCLEKVTLDNKWFDFRAGLADRYKAAWLQKDIENYDWTVFLTIMTAPNENILKSECATYASFLLERFTNYVLDNCNPQQKPDCVKSDPANGQNGNSPVFDEANCPIEINVILGKGKMMLNCQRFTIDGADGLTGEIKFVTRGSTAVIGSGKGTHIPEYGVIKQFIKFDRDNQPSWVGSQHDERLVLTTTELNTFTLQDGDRNIFAINSGFYKEPGVLKAYTTERQINNKVINRPKPKPN